MRPRLQQVHLALPSAHKVTTEEGFRLCSFKDMQIGLTSTFVWFVENILKMAFAAHHAMALHVGVIRLIRSHVGGVRRFSVLYAPINMPVHGVQGAQQAGVGLIHTIKEMVVAEMLQVKAVCL